jgi:hypothetical protein
MSNYREIYILQSILVFFKGRRSWVILTILISTLLNINKKVLKIEFFL